MLESMSISTFSESTSSRRGRDRGRGMETGYGTGGKESSSEYNTVIPSESVLYRRTARVHSDFHSSSLAALACARLCVSVSVAVSVRVGRCVHTVREQRDCSPRPLSLVLVSARCTRYFHKTLSHRPLLSTRPSPNLHSTPAHPTRIIAAAAASV